MMAAKTLPCAFCGALNDPAGTTCFACGGPLDVARPKPEPEITTRVTPLISTPVENPSTSSEPLKQQLAEGAAAIGAGLGLTGVGGLVFRTVAEALAILTAALIVGFNAGRVAPLAGGRFLFLLLGVGGAAVVGIAVGSVIKRGIFVLFSAPFGALLGAAAALILKLSGRGTPWLPLLTAGGACLLALLGGRSNRTGRFSGYQRFRPLLGALGGMFFGLIGFGIGLLIH
jgi:hypothetical protein